MFTSPSLRTQALRTQALWVLACCVGVGAGCAGGAPVGAGAVDAGGSQEEEAAAFDYDWSVRRIDDGTVGEEVELESLRGRTLVVNFWASWCPPCIRELGSFQELEAAVEAQGVDVTFLFVSPEDARIAAGFVQDNGWELPFAVEHRRAPASLGDLVLPTTFIVDRRGTIVLRHRGATDWNQPEVVELLGSLSGSEQPRGGARTGQPRRRTGSRVNGAP